MKNASRHRETGALGVFLDRIYRINRINKIR